MKRLVIYPLILSLLIVSGCKDDDPVGATLQQLAFEKLSGSWTFGADGSIEVDGVDVSANYPGFSLSFANGTYQTTNAADLFDASGTWEWVDTEARQIRLNDGKEITIQTLTLNQFVFTFTFAGASAAGIAGNYTVTVNK